MLCQFRTIGSGVGVLAVCFMLASLSWQFLLLGFALASVIWAVWSWTTQFAHAQPRGKDASVEPFVRRGSGLRGQNVYRFPARDWMLEGEARPFS